MTPGLARSMKCGITPLLPSLRSVIETGTQAAAFGSVSSMRPPAASASRNPSPVLPVGPGEKCSVPVGGMREHRLAPVTSCGKPPQASTTPRLALMRTSVPSRSTIAPRTAPSSTISSTHRRGQPQRDFQVERRFGETPGERVAVGQGHAAAVAHHVHRMLRQALCDIEARRPAIFVARMKWMISLPEPSIMPNTVSSGSGAPIFLMCGPSSWRVERPRHHRTAALRAAGRFGVVVRKGQRHVEADGGLRREKIHRFGTGGKKRIDARGIETVAGLMAQIGPRLIGRFDDAPVPRQRGAGNPEPAAGARGGAAKPRLLLDNEDVEPVMAGGDRRRHAGAAGADHQHIAFVSFLLVVRHALRPVCFILERTFGCG